MKNSTYMYVLFAIFNRIFDIFPGGVFIDDDISNGCWPAEPVWHNIFYCSLECLSFYTIIIIAICKES